MTCPFVVVFPVAIDIHNTDCCTHRDLTSCQHAAILVLPIMPNTIKRYTMHIYVCV